MNNWGGKREGAGRKKGWRKDITERRRRKVRTVAAFDDEWDLINQFAKIVKYGDKEKCFTFLSKFE